MSTTQLWFQVGDEKWHAAENTSAAEGQLVSHCGYVALSDECESVALDPGVLPVSQLPADEPVCLHCQRALEMERREQGDASGEGMPEAPEENEEREE